MTDKEADILDYIEKFRNENEYKERPSQAEIARHFGDTAQHINNYFKRMERYLKDFPEYRKQFK